MCYQGTKDISSCKEHHLPCMQAVMAVVDTGVCVIYCVNPLKPSVHFSCLFKQCYSYESTLNKLALVGLLMYLAAVCARNVPGLLCFYECQVIWTAP